MRASALALTLAIVSFVASDAAAQRAAEDEPKGEREAWFESSSSGYSGADYAQPTPLEIIQRKAQQRAQARIHRIETNAAFGMSNARPTANPLPFTGMYSPAWQMPGGRPYAWHTTRRTQYLIWR